MRMGSMINKIEEFGRNAGNVWKTLDKHGPLTQTNLMKKTKLKEDEFYAAVGWLARENKICKENTIYRLGETNLTDKIGVDASTIWGILDTYGDIDVTYIPKLAEVTERDAFSALGWLAKEEKLKLKKKKPTKPLLYFGLK
jgi:hypothetical protein